jgi:hypothetical protein
MGRGSNSLSDINFHQNVQTVFGTHPASYSYSFLGLKRLTPEINHSLLYSPEVKKERNHTAASVVPSRDGKFPLYIFGPKYVYFLFIRIWNYLILAVVFIFTIGLKFIVNITPCC